MDTREHAARVAELLEQCAADIRNAGSDEIRIIGARLYELATRGGSFDILAANLQRNEYYECQICDTDFHTESERMGKECRSYAAQDMARD